MLELRQGLGARTIARARASQVLSARIRARPKAKARGRG